MDARSDADREPVDPAVVAEAMAGQPPSTDRGAPGHDVARRAGRRTQAVVHRLAGLTYEQIAERVGYADKSSARHAVVSALAEVEAESVADLRTLENARLDRASAALWPQVLAGDVAAVRAWLRISERRAKLNGMDAPTQIEVSSMAKAELEAAFAQLREAALAYEQARDDTMGPVE